MTQTPAGPQPATTLDEMRKILAQLPGPDLEAGSATAARQADLIVPPKRLGRLAELAQWIAGWQGRHPPDIRRPRLAIFAATHGIDAHSGQSGQSLTGLRARLQAIHAGGSPINQVCELADADLRLYELDIENPTADFLQGAAMDEPACANAMAYGMMAPEPGIDLLALGRLSPGGDLSASALCASILGGSAGQWHPATAALPAGLLDRINLAVDGHRANSGDPFDALCRFGGFEMAAIIGAIIGARIGGVPVLLDDFPASLSAAVLWAFDPRSIDHCLFAHLAPGGPHAQLLARLGRVPLLDLGISESGGIGATTAVGLMKTAVQCHNSVISLKELGMVVNGGDSR